MHTTTNDRGTAAPAPISQTEPTTEVATRPQSNTLARTFALGAAALVTPLALGTGVAALTRSRRAGLIAGASTLAAFAALRWQLQRLFTDEPAYEIERRIGELEIRRYAPRVEAHTRIKALDFETSLDEGFSRLAEYIFGGNDDQAPSD